MTTLPKATRDEHLEKHPKCQLCGIPARGPQSRVVQLADGIHTLCSRHGRAYQSLRSRGIDIPTKEQVIATRKMLVEPKPTPEKRVRRIDKLCRYCMRRPATTVDHVIPRAQGGTNTWLNEVGACDECNHRKGARTPKQAGMVLHMPIRMFYHHPMTPVTLGKAPQ